MQVGRDLVLLNKNEGTTLSPKSLFIRIINNQVVTLEPYMLGRHIKTYITRKVKEMEGVCSDFGWVRPKSVIVKDMDSISGEISVESLSGYVRYNVSHIADVFQPATGDVFECFVRVMNPNALKADFIYKDAESGEKYTLMTVLVQRTMMMFANEVDTSSFKIGDKINIKLLWFSINRGQKVLDAGGYITLSKPTFTMSNTSGVVDDTVTNLTSQTVDVDDDIDIKAADMRQVVDFDIGDFSSDSESDENKSDSDVDEDEGNKVNDDSDDEGDSATSGDESVHEEDDVNEDLLDGDEDIISEVGGDDIEIMDDDDE